MELSWLTKLRIVAVLALGCMGLGIAAWPLVAPADPLGAVSASNLHMAETIELIGLSALIGFAAYFVGWPYGRQIGVLAVPAGLAVWAVRSNEVLRLMQMAPDVPGKLGAYAMLRWDSLIWLVLIGAGLAGIWIASKLRPAPPYIDPVQASRPKAKVSFDLVSALVLSLVIGHLLISALAQGTRVIGSSIPTQPATAQIAFAVMVAFGTAGFVTGKFLCLSPFWPTVASAALPIVAGLFYAKVALLEPLGRFYPATCFPNPVLAVLPVQMVAFGALGATAGYWMAVRFKYWRLQQSA